MVLAKESKNQVFLNVPMVLPLLQPPFGYMVIFIRSKKFPLSVDQEFPVNSGASPTVFSRVGTVRKQGISA